MRILGHKGGLSHWLFGEIAGELHTYKGIIIGYQIWKYRGQRKEISLSI